MVKKDQKISIYKDKKQTILDRWQKELLENPRFSSTTLKNKGNLSNYSNLFLNQVFGALESKKIPNFSKETVEPVLSLWHHIIKDQSEGGFSTKDTALLIYALKTSLNELATEAKKEDEKHELVKLEQVLDILGILTFEMYSIENEKLISRQSQQIQYLQTHNLDLEGKLIGSSVAINEVFKAIGLVLENDLTVLLEGESGTGKDLIATIVHSNSKRKKKPFIAINCGAIPRELIESELFGHEKGAFTGADSQRIGKFELAHEGTLFLDEIGELPLDLQVKLLRVLQNKEIQRVGGSNIIPIDVRIIAASNRSLKSLVDEKLFRLDLFYRLNVFPISVPPLRDRNNDVVELANHFIEKYALQFNVKKPILTTDGKQFLLNQSWEGNIRELENCIQRTVVLAQGQPISSALLSMQPGQTYQNLKQAKVNLLPSANNEELEEIVTLDEIEKRAIENALKVKKGNIMQIAKALGVSRTTLYSKIQKYNILLE